MKSNGRINGMKKFNVKNSNHAFYCHSQSNNRGLVMFGNGDVLIFVEQLKSQSWCHQVDYNYFGETHSLCSNGKAGKTEFTPKRFIIIQMK